MSIDLLPEAEERRSSLQRQAFIGGLVLVLVWTILGSLLLFQVSTVSEGVVERDAAAQRVALVRGQVQSLQVFQGMADDAAAGSELLAYAMADEVSWAQLLLDLARGVPDSASFTDINGQITDSRLPTRPGQDVFVQTDNTDIGFFVVNGYTTQLFTPGLEEMLRRFGQIDGLFQQYISSAAADAIGDVPVTRFAAEVRLDDTARTDRYATGLPEAGR
jgi:hypothetical protein